MSTDSPDWIQIATDGLSAQIDPLGAQLMVLRDAGGNDLLWNGDPAVWKGRAPILFPIVGALNAGQYHWRGARHALTRHGFARDRRFEVVTSNASEVLFRQTEDAQTRNVYPFNFELDVTFRVEGSRLTTRASVRNTGAMPLPASLGFHPALRWPLRQGAMRAGHYIEFECDEPAPIRRLDGQGLLTSMRHPTPMRGKRLLLDDALFIEDVIILDRFSSRSLIYGADTGPCLEVGFPDATHLGLWTKPGAGFICIEPWRGVADPVGFAGEFDTKPGTFMVAPGCSEQLAMTIECFAAQG